MGILCGKSYAQGLSTDNKRLVLHRKHTCKKVIHNQAISCVFRLLTIGISVFLSTDARGNLLVLRVFHLCISGVENFLTTVFSLFLFVDCVDNCN